MRRSHTRAKARGFFAEVDAFDHLAATVGNPLLYKQIMELRA
jgi:hypothetical protein